MNRPTLFWKFPLLLLLCCGTAQAEGYNLLFFGNSFSIGNDLTNDVGRLAVADGYDTPHVVSDLAGGEDVAYHITQVRNYPQNNVAHSSIAADTWDYVVVQGYSTEATHLGDPAGFIAGTVTMANEIHEHASGAGAQIVLFETWAREAGHGYYPTHFANPAAMQLEIRTNYLAARQAIDTNAGASVALYAPVGDAFENAGFARSFYNGDLYHASNEGSLLGSMMIYRTIYGEDVSDITYSAVLGWAGVSEATWNSLAATADGTKMVPEPSTWWMMTMFGLLALPWIRQRLVKATRS